jgi:phosphonate transport system substrate-binding protein
MWRRVAFIWPVALLAILLVSACGVFAAPSEGKAQLTLTLGMSARALSGVDLADAEATMKVWFKQSNETEGFTIISDDLRILPDEEAMRKALEKKEINYAVALAIDYLRLRDIGLTGKDTVPGTTGEVMDEYVVLAHREGNIKDLKGLKQKKVLVQVGGLGEVPTIWLDTLLMKQGLPVSRQFCPELKEVPKASEAVLPVFFGQADACVVVKKAFLMMAELNPQIGKQLSVLVQSQSFPRIVSWFGKDCDKQTCEEYRAKLVHACKGPIGRQFMTLMGYEYMVVWDPASLVPLEALLKDYDELRKKAEEGAARGDGVKAGSDAEPSPVTAPETGGRTDAQSSKEK